MEEILYISKKDISLKEALVNKAFLWGESPFTTTRISFGFVQLWKYHLRRLEKMISYFYGNSKKELLLSHIESAVEDISKSCSQEESVYLRITLFEGLSGNVEFFILASSKSVELKSLKVKSAIKESFGGHPSFVKNGDYSLSFKIRNEMKEQGLDDVLFLSSENCVLDLSTSNLVFVKDGVYYTSELIPGVLDGTTRAAFLKFLRERNLPIKEVKIKYEDLVNYDEVLCLNSFLGIRYIESIDTLKFTDESSLELVNEFNNYMKENHD